MVVVLLIGILLVMIFGSGAVLGALTNIWSIILLIFLGIMVIFVVKTSGVWALLFMIFMGSIPFWKDIQNKISKKTEDELKREKELNEEQNKIRKEKLIIAKNNDNGIKNIISSILIAILIYFVLSKFLYPSMFRAVNTSIDGYFYRWILRNFKTISMLLSIVACYPIQRIIRLKELAFIKSEKNSNNKKKNQSKSKAQELKEFKELLDSGIITQTEFDKKKAELLK